MIDKKIKLTKHTTKQKPMLILKNKKAMQEIIADNKDFQSLFAKCLVVKKN